MKERLQKIISSRGVMSRRAAEALIASGGVTVDGNTAFLGDSADPDMQEILISGAPLPKAPERVYIMLNKPRGYTTTLSDPHAAKTVRDLLPPDLGYLVPVGRLDKDSEGLLILTNDGAFVSKMTHPSYAVEKEYHVSVRGGAAEALPLLNKPMTLDRGEQVRAAKAVLLPGGRLSVTISEGKNRQVRRMCSAAGLTVSRLVRVREGNLTLGSLKPGQWRFISGDAL